MSLYTETPSPHSSAFISYRNKNVQVSKALVTARRLRPISIKHNWPTYFDHIRVREGTRISVFYVFRSEDYESFCARDIFELSDIFGYLFYSVVRIPVLPDTPLSVNAYVQQQCNYMYSIYHAMIIYATQAPKLPCERPVVCPRKKKLFHRPNLPIIRIVFRTRFTAIRRYS